MVLNIAPHACHLETVNPAVLGSVRARIERNMPLDFSKILPILIHGYEAMVG